MLTILLIVLLVLLLGGSAPYWGYSKGWGYGPSIFWVIVLVFFLFWLLNGGRVNF